MLGKQLGNYRFLLEDGEDNLGVLYSAEHVAGGYQSLVRLFAAQFADVQPVARYLDIGRAASGLNHPGIWNVRETVWSGRNVIVAGEPLPHGETIEKILRRDHRLWPELVVKLGWQIATALGAAHSASIFHCRLDGDSVYVFQDPAAPGGYRIKIMDFGVAGFLDSGQPNWRSPRVEAFGPPFYMSPEQCRVGVVDYRSDVYSLGALIYHMAGGRPPFIGSSAPELASAHMHSPVETTLQQIDHTIPFELDQLVGMMLNKDPSTRPTMPQVAFELERIAKQYWTTPTTERTVQMDLKIGAAPTIEPEEDEEGGSRLLPVLAVLLALLIAGGTVAVLKPWKKKSASADPTPPAQAEPAPEPTPAPGPAPAPPPKAVEAPKPAPPPPSEVEQQIATGQQALAEERWAEATAAAKAALKAEPKNADAAALLKAAKVEPQNKKLWEDFNKAAAENDAAQSIKRFGKIPSDSIYFPKAQKTFDRVKRDYLHVKKAEAKALAETKMCSKIAPIEKEVKGYFADAAGEIEALSKSCAQP